MTAPVYQVLNCAVTFAGVAVPYVFEARGSAGFEAATPWPTCSVFVPTKPATGNEGDTLTVVAGGGNNVTRGTYTVQRFRATDRPPTVEIIGVGTLARAAQVFNTGEDDLDLDEFVTTADPTGKTIVRALLDLVHDAFPEVTYSAGNLADAGVILGNEAPDAFKWRIGQSALDYIREIDRLEGYRTFQSVDGTIYRRRVFGYPQDTDVDFTLDASNSLPGATGDRNTEQTRNTVRATGWDDGGGSGAVTFTTDPVSNGVQADTEYHIEEFSHPMIERELEADSGDGYSAEGVAGRVLDTVNKEFVVSSVPTYRDDLFGPGQTHLVDLLDEIRVGENMLAVRADWRISATTDGWTQTPSHEGGGLTVDYADLPI